MNRVRSRSATPVVLPPMLLVAILSAPGPCYGEHHGRSTSDPHKDALPITLSSNQSEQAFAMLHRRWKHIVDHSRWQSPTDLTRRSLRQGIWTLMSAPHPCATPTRAKAAADLAHAGFHASILKLDRFRALLVRERRGAFHGGGMYVLRCKNPQSLPTVLQAPHAIFDLQTGEIALRLFVEGHTRGVFLNTVHRFRSSHSEKREDEVHPADVAHEPGNLFQCASLAALASHPRLRLVQLHGFGGSIASNAMIVSSGDRKDPPRDLRDAMAGLFPSVAAFGDDATVLGATTNVQGRSLRRLGLRGGRRRFLHIEMNRASRRRLATDRQLRTRFSQLLEGPWWTKE